VNSSPYRIGVDLGGTKTEVIVLDPEGREQLRERRPTPRAEGYAAILATIAALVETARASLPASAAWTLGMGIPGIIDQSTGLVINANTTELIDQPLGRDLSDQLKHAIAIENDANCFIMAEARQGAARGYDFAFGVIMGTGCGGGLYTGGGVRAGPHGIAGEWGHVSIDPAGLTCWCGNRGCIETKISGSGVERAHRERTGEALSMKEIILRARERPGEARRTFEIFLDDFGRALGGLISILDPDAIVLGGGLSNIDELYTIGLARVRQYAFHRALRTPVLRNQLGDSAGVFGAAWIGVV
jgi:fructokinase